MDYRIPYTGFWLSYMYCNYYWRCVLTDVFDVSKRCMPPKQCTYLIDCERDHWRKERVRDVFGATPRSLASQRACNAGRAWRDWKAHGPHKAESRANCLVIEEYSLPGHKPSAPPSCASSSPDLFPCPLEYPVYVHSRRVFWCIRHSQRRYTALSYLVEKMREVISIHVGQAGVQIGNACCEYPVHLSSPVICMRIDSHDRRVESSAGW